MRKRKPAAALPANNNARRTTWALKVSAIEAHELEKKILFYTKGNRGLFLRAAVLSYKPRKEDFLK